MTLIQYHDYEATFAPRDNETYRLKPEVRQYAGQRFLFRCNGEIAPDDGRDRYAGENEFTLDYSQPMPEHFPAWVAEGDLSDIVEVTT